MPFQSSVSEYGKTLLPIITTKKIHISSKDRNIKVDFCLNIPGSAQFRRDLLSSPVANMYYFYFLILDDASISLLSGLKDPSTRQHLIGSLFRGNQPVRDLNGAFKMVSYEQVLQTHSTIDYNLTDISNDYNNEFRSSVTIDYDPKTPEGITGLSRGGDRIAYEDIPTNALHLVCFIDLDLRGERPPYVSNDTIHYDLLLTKDNPTGRLDVPSSIDSYYIKDPIPYEGGAVSAGMSQTRPYHGPVHYHEADPDNPQAYVGWMAGSPGGDMGPKLIISSTPNYKITSDLKVFEEQLSSANMLDSISPSWISDSLLPKSELRENLRINNLVKSVKELIEDMNKHKLSHCLRNPNIVDYESQQTTYVNFISDPQSTRPLRESHHGFAISINFLDLVKYRSRLGYLLEFHEKSRNHPFVRSCMLESKIRDISFYRYRVVNKPYEINERQSIIYSKYDQDQYGTYIVSSSDRDANGLISEPHFKNRLLEAESQRGNMEEVEILQADRDHVESGAFLLKHSPEFSRQFIVKDRDLFHNVNYGKYSYMVKIILKDGIQRALEKICTASDRVISTYEQFLFRAQIPNNNSDNDAIGNYNYKTRSFTDSFIADRSNKDIIKSAIMTYKNMKYILSSVNPDEIHMELMSLGNVLAPESNNLQDLIQFHDILVQMRACLRSILSLGVDLTSGRKEENYISSIENSTGANLGSIEVLSKTNVISEAIPKDTVIADFSPNPGRPILFPGLDTFRENLVNITDGRFIFPSQFLTLQPVEYEPESEPSLTTSRVKFDLPALKQKKLRKKKKKPKDGKSTSLVTYLEYKNMPSIKKTNTNLKIEYLIRSQSDDTSPQIGETEKPESFYPFATQRYFGGITLGLSGGTVNNFSGGIRDLQGILDFMSPGLSEEVKKSICDSVYKQDDRDFFLTEIERRYEDLVDSRSLMGAFFDYVHNSMLTTDAITLPKRHNISFEDKYKGNFDRSIQKPIKKGDIFTAHAGRMLILSPTQGIVPTTLNNINVKKESINLESKTVVCVKIDSRKSTSAPAVNNVVFLEV